MMRRLVSLLLLAGVPPLLAACPGETTEEEQDATLVVGVQSDDLSSLITSVHIVAKIEGRDPIDITQGTSPILPKEVEIKAKPGTRIEVVVDGMNLSSPAPIITRRAETIVPGTPGKRLLRMALEARCAVTPPGTPKDAGDIPSGPQAEACAAPKTCNAGQCVSSVVPFEALEEYVPNWPATAPDLCRPANAGAPELVLGTGQTDYGPLADGQTLQLEKGPQGGHHIWMAVRMRNLKRSGSRTALFAKLPDDPGAQIYPAAYVFSFDRDEGSYCKLYGLRFQLDSGAPDLRDAYKKFLGKKLEVTAEVTDSIGQRATSTRSIMIADKILCPDGTTTTCVQ